MSAQLAGGANQSFRSLRQSKLMQLPVTWATSQLFGSVHVSSNCAFIRMLTDHFHCFLRRQQSAVSWTLARHNSLELMTSVVPVNWVPTSQLTRVHLRSSRQWHHVKVRVQWCTVTLKSTCVCGAPGVLLILDPHGMPFTRSWCCFELSMCILEKDEHGRRRLKFDVVIGHGEPKLVAEGLPCTDFPVPLLARGFEIDIAQSNASMAQDKKRILNSVCGVDPLKLDATSPPKEHDNYKEVQTGDVVAVR